MVCSIHPSTASDYYLKEQAEYYLHGREPTGRWFAPAGMQALTDGSVIDASLFRRLHEGFAADGKRLSQNVTGVGARVAGYDLTFSAPKSVSILYAIGDDQTKQAIADAQEQAVREALAVLNEQAAFTRRGHGGQRLEKVGLFGATFAHGEARPTERPDGSAKSDPQLHTHAVLFNAAQRQDGSWGTVDGRQLFAWKMTAGALYRSELSQVLEQKLGLMIERTDEHGLFEVRGIPPELLTAFSRRRAEVAADVARRGVTTGEAPALAASVAARSRQAKADSEPDRAAQHARWRVEAAALGFSADRLAALLQDGRARWAEERREQNALRQVMDALPGALTATEAVFDQARLYRAVAESAVGRGANVRVVRALVRELEESGAIVAIGNDDYGRPVYSTPEMIEVERGVQRLAKERGSAARHTITAPEPSLLAGLTEEQVAAVRAAMTGGDLLVIEGAAGAGKSHALLPVVDAYRKAGYRVVGSATAWKVAHKMVNDYEIEARATDAWLSAAKRGVAFLDSKTVLIVDEAGQLSSRQTLAVLKAAQAQDAKVILVGDQKQLQAIGAGPGLRIVAEQVAVARIDAIQRQREVWARHAAMDFAVGRAAEGIAAYSKRGLLTWHDGHKATVAAAVEDWLRHVHQNPARTALVMARTNRDVMTLNTMMREKLKESGQVQAKEVTVRAVNAAGKPVTLPLSVGDQIRFGRRQDTLGVINGTIGRITAITKDGADHANIVAAAQGREIIFSTREIADDSGRTAIAHAYASTIYSAQGATVDVAFAVVGPSLRRNEAYVAASRAREDTRLYVDRQAVKAEEPRQPTNTGKLVLNIDALEARLARTWARVQVNASTLDYRGRELDLFVQTHNAERKAVRPASRATDGAQTGAMETRLGLLARLERRIRLNGPRRDPVLDGAVQVAARGGRNNSRIAPNLELG